MRASIVAEKAGIRSVSIVSAGFVEQARALATSLGMPELAIAKYPDVIMTNDPHEFVSNSSSLASQILDGLARETVHINEQPAAFDPQAIVLEGSLDEVQDFFRTLLWTDGLPIIPPTIDRVETFLKHSRIGAHDVMAVIPPEGRAATGWNIAVNGVMAGCRPDYMPVLVAIVQAIADPTFHLENAGSTAGIEPVIIVSGPVIRGLGFNFGGGVTRPGRQANTSIARFLRLFMRNVAGLRTPPGTQDMATFGLNFIVAIAEDEDAASAIGWPTYGEERGFARGSSVVTVTSTAGITQAGATAGSDAQSHLRDIINEIGDSLWAKVAWVGIQWPSLHPLLVLSPSIAEAIAASGWSKSDLRRRLAESIFVKAGSMETAAWADGATDFSLARFVAEGRIPPVYAESDDSNRLVPAIWRPEDIQIIVAGDPHRNRVMGYIQAGGQGEPVSRLIDT